MKNLNNKKFVLASLTLLTTCLLSAQANVGSQAQGFEFEHKDWQLVCDNTRTCRAVGYQNQDSFVDNTYSVALMLKRKAGMNQRVRAYVMFSDNLYDDQAQSVDLDSSNTHLTRIELSINDIDYGKVTKLSKTQSMGSDAWELTTKQTHALINTLPTSSQIEFKRCTQGTCNNYVVSDAGSTAVLLKMDEMQGRVGTKGAIVKRGNKPESSVLPALPVPIVHALKIDDVKMQRDSDDALFAKLENKMDKLAIAALNITDDYQASDYCDLLTEETSDFNKDYKGWRFTRLNNHQLLASHDCWMAAYNFGTGYWLMNDKPPYQVKLVTDSGVDYTNGNIFLSHKGRGVGDCFSVAKWQWAKTKKGMDFVKTEEFNTGMCRAIAAGGAFVLPTLVTQVIE